MVTNKNAGGAAKRTRATTTLNVQHELHDMARAAVRLVRQKTGRPYSLAQFTREAVTAQLRIIAETYNNGRRIEPDEEPLEPGRAV